MEAVIALPQNLYLNTGIACSLLVLSRNNKNIRMIDATEMVSVGRRQNILSDENVSEIVELLNTDDKNSNGFLLKMWRKMNMFLIRQDIFNKKQL